MQIEKVQLGRLKPLDENVRNHSKAQIQEFVRALNQFGQTRAFVIDEDNNILIGNGLYLAMMERGDTEVDAYRMAGLTETQKKKLILTDNKIYSLGTDNYEMVDKFIQEITLDAGDFDIAGFDEDILRSMTQDLEAGIDDDNYDDDNYEYEPEIVSEPVCEPSQADKVQTYTEPIKDAPASAQAAHGALDKSTARMSVTCPCCGEIIYIN